MTEGHAQVSVSGRSNVGFSLVRLGAAGLLLFALGQNPYDFYTIMRWVVCGVCSYAAFVDFGRDRSTWAWLFVVVAVAFNPIVPVRLSRETWAPIDILAAGLLVVSTVLDWRRK
jgi:hypothetical protein